MASNSQLAVPLTSASSIADGERIYFEFHNYEWNMANMLRDFMHQHIPKDKIMLNKSLKSHEKVLAKLKNRGIIKNDQWVLLYPNNGETDSDEFDITLMLILLRNLCTLSKREQDLVDRCNQLRNQEAHLGKATSHAVYNKLRNSFEQWFKDMGMSDDQWSILKNRIVYNDVGDFKFGLKQPKKSFVGRTKELNQLYSGLHMEGHDIVVVKGLSGVGKSELIRKYCQNYDKQYDNILFINSESEGTLEDFFVGFSKYIGLISANETNLSIKMLLPKVYSFLSTKNCLLIFDNADKANILDDYMPTTSSKSICKIIITTQFQFSKTYDKQLELQPLDLNEGLQFFKGELGDDINSADCKKLINALSSLPIAFQLACSYIKTRNISISVFLKNHEAKFNQLWSSVDQDDINKNTKTVLTTWEMAFAHIRTDTLAIRLIRMFSLIDGKFIAEELLAHMEGVEELQLKDSLHNLRKYSLIDWQLANKSSFINIHNLVQQVIKDRLTDNEQESVINDLFRMCKNLIGTIDHKEHQNFGDMWLQHIFSSIDQVSSKLQVSNLIYSVIQYAADAAVNGGKIKSAMNFIKKCKRILANESHRLTNIQAMILQHNGKYGEAIKMYREVLKSQEAALGPDHPDTLTTKNNIAVSLQSKGQFDEAIKMKREVLKSREAALGPDHPDTLTTKNSIAVSLQSKGQFDEAIKMYREVLKSREAALGPDHPDTLRTKNNIAVSLQSKGQYDEAIKMYQKVLKSQEAALGPDHPDTLRTLRNLTIAKEERGLFCCLL